jgi:hypothetical protein
MLFLSISEVKRLQAERDIQGLVQALSYKNDVHIMIAAATALGEIEDESAIDPLMDILEGKIDTGRLEMIAQSMGLDLRDARARRALAGLLQAKIAGAQEAVTQALEHILHIDDAAHDLARIDLPREGSTMENEHNKSKRTMVKHFDYGPIKIDGKYQEDVALKQPFNIPWVGSMNGEAIVVLRLEDLSRREALHMKHAVTNNMVLLVPVFIRCPTFPVLSLRFSIYDNPTDPLTVEGPRNIVKAEVQNFLQAVLSNGGGNFYLYAGVNAEPIGGGTFSLRMPPFYGPGYPYKTQPGDLRYFWLMLNLAAKHLESIPVAARDFETAENFYREHTSL